MKISLKHEINVVFPQKLVIQLFEKSSCLKRAALQLKGSPSRIIFISNRKMAPEKNGYERLSTQSIIEKMFKAVLNMQKKSQSNETILTELLKKNEQLADQLKQTRMESRNANKMTLELNKNLMKELSILSKSTNVLTYNTQLLNKQMINLIGKVQSLQKGKKKIIQTSSN